MNKRALVFLNGHIASTDFIQGLIKKDDLIISVDGGIRYIKALNLVPDVIIGDFDSSKRDEIRAFPEAIVMSFKQEKNATDGDIAIEYIIDSPIKEVLIFGALGNRVDHMLSNISMLEKLYKNQVKAEIMDTFNRILYTENQVKIFSEGFKYFSIIPVSATVTGVNIQGGKYPLVDAQMNRINSLGLSNEFLKEEVIISIEKGAALIVRSKDKKGF